MQKLRGFFIFTTPQPAKKMTITEGAYNTMTSENKTNYALIFTICFYFSLTQKRPKK